MSEQGPERTDLDAVRRTLAHLEADMYQREPGTGDIHWYQPIFECLERLPTAERAAWRERHAPQVRRVLRPDRSEQ